LRRREHFETFRFDPVRSGRPPQSPSYLTLRRRDLGKEIV
jgi:hypothetical protein